MNRLGKIIIVFMLLFFAGHKGFAQVGLPQRDTLHLKVQKSQSDLIKNEQGVKGKYNKQRGIPGNNYASQAIKQINGRRPDMSRARGARPPSIVRPTGSRIPKGVGKPGGAFRHGGR
jgi:hypothetical protein